MLLVNFLTFIMKILYTLYMVFILIPIAIIFATIICIKVLIEYIYSISIHKFK
jgi:hypothetical protein